MSKGKKEGSQYIINIARSVAGNLGINLATAFMECEGSPSAFGMKHGVRVYEKVKKMTSQTRGRIGVLGLYEGLSDVDSIPQRRTSIWRIEPQVLSAEEKLKYLSGENLVNYAAANTILAAMWDISIDRNDREIFSLASKSMTETYKP